jgi:hypothetical protein
MVEIMTLKDFGIEFPRDKSAEALYGYIYRLVEILDIILSGIDESNLSDELKQKLGIGGDKL